MMVVDYSLYLVTDAPERYRTSLLANVEAAVAGGVTVVQYRATTGTKQSLYQTALALRDLLHARGVPLIINDHVDLALAVDAEGVHIGQNDLPVEVVRRLIGPDKLLGLSITAAAQLATVPPGLTNYLGVGPVYPTGSKADAAPALGLDALAEIVTRTPLPVVAIGGIGLPQAGAVFRAGAAGIAVVSALSFADEPAAAARALLSAKTTLP